jgi:membrane-bound lytic murein transglycosylase D
VSFEDVTSNKNDLEQRPQALEAIPAEMNPSVQKWIHYFSQKDAPRFQRFLDQGHTYRDTVEALLEKNQLPRQLYYLAMIESGYSNHATSSAKAAGVWQFIPATARRYGLQINSQIDERRNPIRSTEAAILYLKDLYNVFGSWHLALAAYNAGEYRIMGAVIRGKSRDFWTLVKNRVLPLETANYIPKFLAAIKIGGNPDQYGFLNPSTKPDAHASDQPTLDPPVMRLDWQLAQKPLLHRAQHRLVHYRVKRGDRLTKIARRFRVSVHSIRVGNSLRHHPIRIGQVLRIHTSQLS